MKKILMLTLLLLALALPALAEQTTTVLLYVCGSDLESEEGVAQGDFEEAIYAGASGPVNVLAMTGGCEYWWDESIPTDSLTIHKITARGMVKIKTLPLASMGSADTLKSFVEFGVKMAPADRYLLVLWGHGYGAVGGVCGDPLFDEDYLMPDELAEALHGVQLDAVFFDSCLMAQLEYAQALQGCAKYMVASQADTVGSGLRYDKWLGALADDPGIETVELCTLASQTYIKNNDQGVFGDPCTISVLDLAATDAVTGAVENLSAALYEMLQTSPEAVLERRASFKSYGEFELEVDEPTDMVDAVMVAEAFHDVAPELCDVLREAVDEMVVYNGTTRDMVGCANGVSIMMPYAVGDWTEPVYDWYGPQAGESDYAALVVRMAELAEEKYWSEYKLVGSIMDGFKSLIENAAETTVVPPPESMWEGLYE